MKYIIIDGRRYVWREIVRTRREQVRAAEKMQQGVLFELKTDCRPTTERTAGDRYLEPGLFQ